MQRTSTASLNLHTNASKKADDRLHRSHAQYAPDDWVTRLIAPQSDLAKSCCVSEQQYLSLLPFIQPQMSASAPMSLRPSFDEDEKSRMEVANEFCSETNTRMHAKIRSQSYFKCASSLSHLDSSGATDLCAEPHLTISPSLDSMADPAKVASLSSASVRSAPRKSSCGTPSSNVNQSASSSIRSPCDSLS